MFNSKHWRMVCFIIVTVCVVGFGASHTRAALPADPSTPGSIFIPLVSRGGAQGTVPLPQNLHPDFRSITDIYKNGIPDPQTAFSINNISQVSYDDIPECPAEMHSDTLWHPLYVPPELITQAMNDLSQEDLTQTGCHYTHEHKDNPHLLDDVFGPINESLYTNRQSISYPWQTFAGADITLAMPTADTHLENEAKHNVYSWIVLENIDPIHTTSQDGSSSWADTLFIKNLRTQVHAGLHAMGMPVRFHSDWMEMQICKKANPEDCGTARFGGWGDYGQLLIDGEVYPLPGGPMEDPELQHLTYEEKLASVLADVNERGHRTGGNSAKWTFRSSVDSRFYAPSAEETAVATHYNGLSFSTIDSFHRVDPTNMPNAIAVCRSNDLDPEICNNSTFRLDFLIARFRHHYADATGYINFDGYTDRHHRRVYNCDEPSLNCVPMVLEHVPALRAVALHNPTEIETYRDEPHKIREYDVSPAQLKVGQNEWIEYPN